MMNQVVRSLAVVLALGLQLDANAQPYPSRPLRMIVPYPAGGASDVLARMIAQKLNESWHQPVVVDNRPGAGTIIAYDIASRSPPDGYTLLQCSDSLATNVSLYSKLPYDALRDLSPVTRTGSLALLIMANNSLPASSVKELVALAKAKPTQINYASFGMGTSSHLAGELFKRMAGIDMTHVPFKGAPPAITAVIAGEVQIFFSGLPPGLPFVKSGKAKAIAVTSLQRSPLLPSVATVAESGFPGYEAISWSGMLVPKGTPKPIIAKLNAEVTRILRLPDIRASLISQGFEPQPSSPEQFDLFLRAEMKKWAEVARASNVRVE